MQKNSKILIILSSLLIAIVVVANFIKINDKTDSNKNDAFKFKEEYESLNYTEASNGKTYPTVTLDDDNPFVYASEEKIVDTLKSGTGLIYLGFPNCPWCRNAINVLQKVNTDKILYLDMTNQRDVYENNNGKLEKTKDGTKSYYEMLDILGDILPDYEVDGISTGEKRIYVPLIIGVNNGNIVGYHADTVDLPEGQTPYDLLTDAQQSDLKLIYDEINSKVKKDTCDVDEEHGC